MPTGHGTVARGQLAGCQAGQTRHWAGPAGPQAGQTGPRAGPAGSQAGPTGRWAGQAAADAVDSPAIQAATAAVASPAMLANAVDVVAPMSRVGGEADRSADVLHDYLSMMTGTPFDASTIKWRLASSATPTEFQLWESHIEGGFERCKVFDSSFGGQTEFAIAYRRVDDVVASWYRNALIVAGIVGLRSSWADFKQFLRARFKFTRLNKHVVCSNTTVERKPGSDTMVWLWRRMYH